MEEGLKWFATLGVGGVLAGIIFWFYRQDVKQFTDEWRGQRDVLLKVVQDNALASAGHAAAVTAMTAAVTTLTSTIAAMTATIEALHRRDDRIEEALTQVGFRFQHRGKSRGDESHG